MSSGRGYWLAAQQVQGEFGEFVFFAVDRDCTAVLLGDDVVPDRQAQPSVFAGRFVVNRNSSSRTAGTRRTLQMRHSRTGSLAVARNSVRWGHQSCIAANP
jgi:hypothetical protein